MKFHSQTSHKTEIISILLKSKLDLSSRVDVGNGALEHVGYVLGQLNAGKQALVVTQTGLPTSYVDTALGAIEAEGIKTTLITVPDGEDGKDARHLLSGWEQLQNHAFERKDTVVAIGGGAVSDLAGFIASTYLRGINLVTVPTTLLAQVDAAIGGKTGINLVAGKNLAGSFYLPAATLIDPSVLTTLPERELRSGLGEIVKYAFIERTIAESTDYKAGPASFLSVLESAWKDGFDVNDLSLPGIISTCVRMKLAVVGRDFREGRLRRCLNLGHTLAHAIEKVSAYRITHGEAVAIGLVFALRVAEKMERLPADVTKRLVKLLQNLALPTEVPGDLDQAALVKAIGFDKKAEQRAVKFVLPVEPLGTVDLDAVLTVERIGEYL